MIFTRAAAPGGDPRRIRPIGIWPALGSCFVTLALLPFFAFVAMHCMLQSLTHLTEYHLRPEFLLRLFPLPPPGGAFGAPAGSAPSALGWCVGCLRPAGRHPAGNNLAGPPGISCIHFNSALFKFHSYATLVAGLCTQ